MKTSLIVIGTATELFQGKIYTPERDHEPLKYLVIEEDGILKILIHESVVETGMEEHSTALRYYITQKKPSSILVKGGGYIDFGDKYIHLHEGSGTFGYAKRENLNLLTESLYPDYKKRIQLNFNIPLSDEEYMDYKERDVTDWIDLNLKESEYLKIYELE